MPPSGEVTSPLQYQIAHYRMVLAGEIPASKLAGRKAAASSRTRKLRIPAPRGFKPRKLQGQKALLETLVIVENRDSLWTRRLQSCTFM
jgi:hypothetical protein